MSNEKHTPTPWRLDERIRMAQIYAGPERNCLATGAEVVASWGHELTDQERANAAFIVRACNSHEALVKELELADKMLGVLLNALPQEDGQPTRLEVYKKLCALHDGEGVIRSEERRAALKQAKENA